ncbi:hypothetical protein CS369_09610 [Candidatus Symbiopectobacterium sp. 'North America']|uniref:leucine-rich repeat domain-containing protein n=1 Tax=Candidatus Symbiopectobacterium sp. 'North America' TaxID=2794574 RepID=UPI0018C97C0C|nr:hypothetical protein [Candidatus Symbiopectobacterium sp. 'North America']
MNYVTSTNLLHVTPQINNFETTHSFQAGNISESTQTQPSKEQYQAIWSTWENNAPQG